MLRTRVLTAVVILAVTLSVVFLAPTWLFRLAVALLLLTGCWEFRRIADLSPAAGWTLLVLQAAIIGGMYLGWPPDTDDALRTLAVGCGAWLLMYVRLLRFRPDDRPNGGFRRLGFASALAAVSFCCFALWWLRDQPNGPVIVFLLFLLIWASDVGAYFAGRLFGRHRLAPVISPKKTWEGVYGGIALAIAAAFLLANGISGLGVPALALVVTSAVTTLASVGGDLFISIHKRTVQMKDTGALFPGHGGVLDRYDSLLAGAPFFALAWGWLT